MFEIIPDFKGVMERLSEALNITRDDLLADELGVAQSTLSTWKGRNKIPYESIAVLAVTHGFDLNYVLLGSKNSASVEIDSDLFTEVISILRGDKSELNGAKLELLIPEILSLYNNATQCESENEKQRMFSAQLNLLNRMVIKNSLQHWEDMKSQDNGLSGYADEPIATMKKELSKINEEDAFKSTQNFNAPVGQAAARDIVNHGKDDK